LEGVKISLNNNTAELTGYDLELGIKTKINVESEDEGEFVLNSRLLCEIVRKLPDGKVVFKVEYDGTMATSISCKNAVYNIIALPADDFPSLPDCGDGEKISFSQPLLKNMINQTVYAAATGDNKPILTGELFDIGGNVFNLVAIDGYRLAIRKEHIDVSGKHYFVVKARTLSEVSKLLGEKENDENLTLYKTNKHILFEVGEYIIVSRLLEGDFHNYKGSVPVSHQTEIIIDSKLIIDCLERCSLLITDKAKAPVKCLFKDGKANISCSTALGRLDEEFDIDIEGSSVEIGFNCRYLLEAVRASESDKIRMQLNGSLSPMKIVPLDGDDYLFLVLPVRLKND
jgi:DNA polymerase-3 subunit beta